MTVAMPGGEVGSIVVGVAMGLVLTGIGVMSGLVVLSISGRVQAAKANITTAYQM